MLGDVRIPYLFRRFLCITQQKLTDEMGGLEPPHATLVVGSSTTELTFHQSLTGEIACGQNYNQDGPDTPTGILNIPRTIRLTHQ